MNNKKDIETEETFNDLSDTTYSSRHSHSVRNGESHSLPYDAKTGSVTSSNYMSRSNDEPSKKSNALPVIMIGGVAAYMLFRDSSNGGSGKDLDKGKTVVEVDKNIFSAVSDDFRKKVHLAAVIKQNKAEGLDLLNGISEEDKAFYEQHKADIDKMVDLDIDYVGEATQEVSISDGEVQLEGHSKVICPKYAVSTVVKTYSTVDETDIHKANNIIKENKIPGFIYGMDTYNVGSVGSYVDVKYAEMKELGGDSVSIDLGESAYINLEQFKDYTAVVAFNNPVMIRPVVEVKSGTIIGPATAVGTGGMVSQGKLPSIVLQSGKFPAIEFSSFIESRTMKGKGMLFCKGKTQVTKRKRYDCAKMDSITVGYIVVAMYSNSKIFVMKKEQYE